MTIRVLLVEDDVRLADSVTQYLDIHGIVVDNCQNGKQAMSLIHVNEYDVIISDVNMPRMNGLELCRYLRDEGIATPFIFISANGEVEDKVLGFDTGADDYLSKPFDLRELLARIKALSNRRGGCSNKIFIEELSLQVYFRQREVLRDNCPLKLTPSSWKMLAKLARSYPEPVSKTDLEFAIWGDELPDSNSLKVHIHNLRKCLDKPFNYPILHSVHGYGFRLARAQADRLPPTQQHAAPRYEQ